MKTSQKGINLIKSFEGCKLQSYRDSVGVLTIGYGHTLGVYTGMRITLQEAEDLLRNDLIIYESCINKNVKVDLTQNEFDSLVSWTYNLGCGSLKKSTMLKYLNENKKQFVTSEMIKWVKAGGRVLKGLIRRREAEAVLFAQAEAIEGVDIDKPNSNKAL